MECQQLDHSPGDQIIQGVVPGWSTRSLLTDKAVQSLRINQGPTVTFMWHAELSQAAVRFLLLHHQASTHVTILALPEASLR